MCLSFTSVDPPHSFCTGIMQTEIPSHTNEADKIQWFVMRDLKRTNSKLPAYKLLAELNIEFFTPMVCKTVIRGGKRCLMKVPFMQDLLFVRDSRRHLDPIVAGIAKLQYRYIHGGQHILMTIRDADMERFKRAVESADAPPLLPSRRDQAVYDRQEGTHHRRALAQLRGPSAEAARLQDQATVRRAPRPHHRGRRGPTRLYTTLREITVHLLCT